MRRRRRELSPSQLEAFRDQLVGVMRARNLRLVDVASLAGISDTAVCHATHARCGQKTRAKIVAALGLDGDAKGVPPAAATAPFVAVATPRDVAADVKILQEADAARARLVKERDALRAWIAEIDAALGDGGGEGP